MYKAIAILLLTAVTQLTANEKDDLLVVDRMLKLYPQVDLTKEALFQTELVSARYGEDAASILKGKINYKINRLAGARKAFEGVGPDSEYFSTSVFEYFSSASSEQVKDAVGVVNSSELFIKHQLWQGITDKESDEWKKVENILTTYRLYVLNDTEKLKKINKLLKELGIDYAGSSELQLLVDSLEKEFLNDWKLEQGKSPDAKKLEPQLAKLRDLEFGEMNLNYFLAFPLRARILTLLGKEDEALKLLTSTKEKIQLFDEQIEKNVNADRSIPSEDKNLVIENASVMPQWYYANGVASFSKFRKLHKEGSADASKVLYGKQGSVVYFFLAVKKFPQNKFSVKSILAYQKLNQHINDLYKKNLKALVVSDLVQGKAFYQNENFEEALGYLKKATGSKDRDSAYEACNFAVAAAVKIEDWKSAGEIFKSMAAKYSDLNKAPKNYVSKLTNYLVANYINKSKDDKSFLDRACEIFESAGEAGKDNSNAAIKYILLNRYLSFEELNDKKTEYLIKSLETDHALSVESVKALYSLGIRYDKDGMNEQAVNAFSRYLERIKTFSSQVDSKQIKVRILLTEKLIALKRYEDATMHLVILKKSAGKTFLENVSALDINLEYSAMLDKKSDPQKFIKLASDFVESFKKSDLRPYFMARLATVFQDLGENEKANNLYNGLKNEYPDHDAIDQTSLNQVLAYLKLKEYSKALKSLSESSRLGSLKQQTIYSIISKIFQGFEKGTYTKTDAEMMLKCLSVITEKKETPGDYQSVNLSYIKAVSLRHTEKYEDALKIIEKTISEQSNNALIIEIKLEKARCLAAVERHEEIARLYGDLQSLITRLNGGRGDYGLNLKVSVEVARLYYETGRETYLKKARGIAFLVSQYNRNSLEDKDLPALEEAEFLNVILAGKLNTDDFSDLKKDFLRRYPSSDFAPELRKL